MRNCLACANKTSKVVCFKVTRWLNFRVNHAHSNLTGNTYNIFTSETIMEANHVLWFISHLILLYQLLGSNIMAECLAYDSFSSRPSGAAVLIMGLGKLWRKLVP